jgi:hypothetical protein
MEIGLISYNFLSNLEGTASDHARPIRISIFHEKFWSLPKWALLQKNLKYTDKPCSSFKWMVRRTLIGTSAFLFHMFLEPYSNVEEAFKIGPRTAKKTHQIQTQFKRGKGWSNTQVSRNDVEEEKLAWFSLAYMMISCMSSGNIIILTSPPLSLRALAYWNNQKTNR